MTGDDYIQLAGNLVQNKSLGGAEARYRSAISRAYYGAFHLEIVFLAELGIQVKKNHLGHNDAYVLLTRSKAYEALRAAELLNELRSRRNYADYRLDKVMADQSSAMEHVESAIEIRTCLARCRQEPTRSEIVAALAGKNEQ